MSIRFPLSSSGTFVHEGGTERYKAAIPGTVHEALIEARKIEDPFYRLNEADCQWVDKASWRLIVEQEISPQALAHDRCELVFEGLDTYTDVFLNGIKLGSTDNMFRTWRFDIRKAAKAGRNDLEVLFRSPIAEDLPKLETLGYGLPAVNDQSEQGGLDQKRVSVFARKAPYHYGWDWGPRLVTSGVWKPAYIEAWNAVRIESLYARTPVIGTSAAEVLVETVVSVLKSGTYTLSLGISEKGPAGNAAAIRVSSQTVSYRLSKGRHVLQTKLLVQDPRLWWCNGYGEAFLYGLEASLRGEGSETTEKIRFGIRTVELRREPDAFGKSFEFVLNGIPVFAKGANYIPNDNMLPRVTESSYHHILQSARDANMNMIRVWGGGVYEKDIFYDLCDELGLMVWQDFMFACSMYPGDEAFMSSVRAEAEETIVRLRGRACLALWCGNNEMDTAWSEGNEFGGWGWKQAYSAPVRKTIWQAYDRIFHQILPGLVARFDPQHSYWPSSPLADWGVSASNDSDSGDVHYWGVWHNEEPFERYREVLPRFMSEYGFQSFPEPANVRRFARLPEDASIDSPVMKSHQRSPKGNGLIDVYMRKYMKVPADFDDFLIASQILQAEGMKIAIEAHRTRKPRVMGTLYWQLNDCWPAASWSSIDYYGTWKAAHYYVRRAYSPLLISVEREFDSTGNPKDAIAVRIASDLREPVAGRMFITVASFDGSRNMTTSVPVVVPALGAVEALSLSAARLTEDSDEGKVALRVWIQDDTGLRAECIAALNTIRNLALEDAGLSIKVHSRNLIEVSARRFARCVYVDISPDHPAAADLRFLDNYFDLMPGTSRMISVQSPIGAEDLGRELRARTVKEICGL